MAINEKKPGDCGFIAFKTPGGRCEVYAPSALAARELALKHFNVKPSKAYTVSVHLAERPDSSTVLHTASD